jgi:hypothetical protein
MLGLIKVAATLKIKVHELNTEQPEAGLFIAVHAPKRSKTSRVVTRNSD